MFCKSCGKQLNDNASFCSGCGRKIDSLNQQSNQFTSSTTVGADATFVNVKTKQKNKIIGMVTVGVAMVLVLMLAVSLFGGKSAEATAEKMLEATVSGDAKTYLSLIHSDVLEIELENEGYDNKYELIDELNEIFEDSFRTLTSLSGLDMDELAEYITFEYGDKQDLEDDDFEYLQEKYDDIYDVKVKDACMINLTMVVEYQGKNYTRGLGDFYLVKIGAEWYLDVCYNYLY